MAMNGYETKNAGICPFEGQKHRRFLNAPINMDFTHRLGDPNIQPVQSLLTPESVEVQSYPNPTEFGQMFVAQHRNREMANLLQFRRRLSMRISGEEYNTLQSRPIAHEIIQQFLHTINEQKRIPLANGMRMFPVFSTILCRGKRIPIRDVLQGGT